MSTPRYCLDTSAFVEPWVRLYPHDNFPGYWTALAELTQAGEAIASDVVQQDLERKDDDLLAWVAQHAHAMFQATDLAVQREARRILGSYPGLTSPGHGHSDPFVIALAVITDTTVVTEERSRSLQNPKIPDVCRAIGVPCVRVVEMIRAENWRF